MFYNKLLFQCLNLYYFYAELFISFENAEYSAFESNGTVSLCLVTNIGIAEAVEVRVQLSDEDIAKSN